MQFSLAAGERPQQPRFILFVGEGLQRTKLYSIYEFREYMPEVKWDRTRYNERDTFDNTNMRTELKSWSELATGGVPHRHYIIAPEMLHGSEGAGIMAVLKEFKAVLSNNPNSVAPLSVVTLNTHVATELLRILMGLGFGPQILVLHFPKEGDMSMGWVEQQKFVANRPFKLEATTVSVDQVAQLGLLEELI